MEGTQTKECIGCFQAIHEKALKCPYCHQIQSKLYTLPYSNWIVVPLLILLVGLVGYLLVEASRVHELTISETKLYKHAMGSRDFVTCNGSISNTSSTSARNIYLQATFYAKDGTLLDTFSYNPQLYVRAGREVEFRVSGFANKPLSEYSRCTVDILHKRPVDIPDNRLSSTGPSNRLQATLKSRA